MQLAWFVVVMAWCSVRIIVVAQWLVAYGVDPWMFALIDVGSAIPYAICSARLVGALVDGQPRVAMWWAAPTVATFAAPDVYIFSVGRGMPWATYVVVAAVAVVGAAWATRDGRARVRAERAAAALAGEG
jgi:hypothetical protein